jgi:hypothetical protein
MGDVVQPASRLEGWKTFLFNTATLAALAGVGYFAEHGSEVIPAGYWPFVAAGISAVNIWLRTQTKTPIFNKAS